MSDFVRGINRVLKYSHDNWEAFQRLLHDEPHHRWGGPDADHTLRKAAADVYREATGDEHGAGLLEDPNQHVVIDGGKVRRGSFTLSPVLAAERRLVAAVANWANVPNPWGSVAPHGVVLHEAYPIKGGHVRLTMERQGRLERDSSGAEVRPEGTGVLGYDVSEVHPSQIVKSLVEAHEAALSRRMGWNVNPTGSSLSPGEWQLRRKQVHDALNALKTAPAEEPVSEDQP